MTKAVKGRSSYQIIYHTFAKPSYFCKKCRRHSKFQEINVIFVIDKDEMLSCVELEALKSRV